MDFSFTPDQTLLRNSARAFLDEHCKPATVRLLWDDPRGASVFAPRTLPIACTPLFTAG